MDRKGNKGKQVISNDSRNRSWPDLPDELIKLISNQSSLLQSVSYDGVEKGWTRKPSTQEFPMLCPITYYEFWGKQNVYSPELLCKSNGTSPEDDPIIGSSHGELILRSQVEPHDYYLWSQTGSYKRRLPEITIKNTQLRRFILSSSPDYKTNSTVLVLHGGYKPGFLFCKTKKRDKIWIKEECTLLDPNSSPNNRSIIEFTNAVFLKGKFYALSIQGTLAVIDTDSDISPRVRILGAKRGIPTTWSRYFKEYMIESCGEILLVFLIWSKLPDKAADHVEVFRLDLQNMSWVKMESLGERTLFLGSNCCMPVSEASKVGFRANCVYFTHGRSGGWWVFEMEGGTIKPVLNDGTCSTTPVSE